MEFPWGVFIPAALIGFGIGSIIGALWNYKLMQKEIDIYRECRDVAYRKSNERILVIQKIKDLIKQEGY